MFFQRLTRRVNQLLMEPRSDEVFLCETSKLLGVPRAERSINCLFSKRLHQNLVIYQFQEVDVGNYVGNQ